MINFDLAECPLIPMWAITGSPARVFLYERMKNFRSVGISQLMIYPRSGLELEYMSDAWLDRCEWICEDAAALGFTSIWLYDEKNWPSGTCSGEVIRKNPKHAIRALCVSEPKPGEYEFQILYDEKFSSLCDPDAVDSFIHLTHERYEKRIGKYFGKLVKGFFTDEPEIARFMDLRKDGYIKMIPWFEGSEEEYRKLTGGSLRDDVVRGLKTGTEFWRGPYSKVLAKRFRETYSDRISRWCAERGMVLTGHLMDEYNSDQALRCNGHILKVLSGFSLPGIDDIFVSLKNDRIEYLTYSSGMYAIEKQGHGGLAELFAVRNCDMTLEEMCSIFYLNAAFGIDHYVLAVSQTEVRGNIEKKYWFNPFSETQPWFDAFRELGEHAKKAARWAKKEKVCDVAVRYPYEPQPLTDLLRHLADAQLNWKLVMPEDETDAPVILSCFDGRIREERSGRCFFDFGMRYDDLLRKTDRQAAVYEADGSLARNVFVRAFKDHSALVINLSEKDRDLVLKTDGKTIPFRLYANAAFTWDPAEKAETIQEPVFDLPKTGWEITLDSPNTMRADFEDGTCEFTLKEDLTNLKLVVRNYGDPVEVLLDGKKIETSSSCTSLRQGFREIYRESAGFGLSKGQHELKLCCETTDYPYLPAVFLVGDFAVDPDKNLSVYRNDGIGLYGYVGKIILKQKLEIPAGTGSIRAETLGLVAELLLDGKSLGRRIRNPFCWKNPGKTGTVEAELVLSTSCGHLFGEKASEDPNAWGWLKQAWPRNGKPLLAYSKPKM